MTSIQRSLAWNCRPPSSRLNLARIPMPTAAVSNVVSSAAPLIRFSSAFGIISTMIMPTMGMKTASVRAQSSNQSIGTIPLGSGVGEQDGEAQEPHRSEHEQCVPLDAARLEVAQETAALAGDLRDPVDRAVDTLLIQGVVGEVAERLG